MMDRKQYAEAIGKKAAALKALSQNPPVIDRYRGTTETPEWAAWVKYWTAAGARATLEIIENRSQFTVPTALPWEFDIEYNG